MNLLPTPEQDQLRAAIRALLDEYASTADVRETLRSESGYDDKLWRRLGHELSVLGLVVPQEYGGASAGHTERSIVAEELGRALVPSPFFGSAVLAVDLLLALPDEKARREFLPGLASGDVLGAVAVAEDGGPLLDVSKPGPAVMATRHGDGWVVDGTKSPVADGMTADVFFVLASTETGLGIFRIDAHADGLVRTPLRTLDVTRQMARVDLAGVSATRLTGDAQAAVRRVAHTAAVALGADQVGGMRRALELTVDYAKTRVQFGRPIGSYQAVQHGCADMYCRTELATSVFRRACWVADREPDGLPQAVALLLAYAGPAYVDVARGLIQYHGGIGYTWEHDAHLYYRRAKSDELLLTSPRCARLELADMLRI